MSHVAGPAAPGPATALMPELDAADRVVAGPIAPTSAPPELPGVQGPVTVATGATLWHLDTGGDGEGVVLLHPGVGNLRLWAHQVHALATAGYRVIAYDRPGHGRSPAPASAPERRAALLDAGGQGMRRADPEAELGCLVDLLGLGRFHLVGSAQGARIAAGFASRRPSALRSLTLASATLFTTYARAQQQMAGAEAADAATGVAPAVAPDSLPHGFAALPAWFRELGPAYRQADPDGVIRWLTITGADEDAPVAPGPLPRPATGTVNAATSIPGGGAPRPADGRALAGAARVRTLTLTGDADPFAPPPACRAYAAGHPGCALAIIPEAGHSPFWERPDLFNAVLLGFLAGA